MLRFVFCMRSLPRQLRQDESFIVQLLATVWAHGFVEAARHSLPALRRDLTTKGSTIRGRWDVRASLRAAEAIGRFRRIFNDRQFSDGGRFCRIVTRLQRLREENACLKALLPHASDRMTDRRCPHNACPAIAKTIVGKVVGVSDGDTIKVL